MDGRCVTQELDPISQTLYRRTLRVLNTCHVDYLVGGAYSFARYTGIERHTKDFDIFVRPDDCLRVLQLLAGVGFRTELPFPHWLGKAYCGDNFIDVIFSSGNGVARVDNAWFDHAVPDHVLGVPALLCPVEETIWSKSFIMERERYDGADIAHLLRASGRAIDWPRLLERFGPHWRVLLSHLVLFGFIYPGERDTIPAWVLDELLGRLRDEIGSQHSTADSQPHGGNVCRGTLLSRAQYLVDVEHWGYRDARLQPGGSMSLGDVTTWTDAIGSEQPTACVRPVLRDPA
jgi:hypothetical protein